MYKSYVLVRTTDMCLDPLYPPYLPHDQNHNHAYHLDERLPVDKAAPCLAHLLIWHNR